jgi:hypothetical protein
MEYGENKGGWNTFKDFGSKWMQRVQLSGTSWVHAPVVVQSYLLLDHHEIEAIDILKYARHSFNDKKVSTFVVTDGSGNAAEELENMLHEKYLSKRPFMDSLKRDSNCSCNCENYLMHDVRTRGPGLVHCFKADANFKKCKANVHANGKIIEMPYFDGAIGEGSEQHAMVLVGLRKVEGQWRCLLQNWWPDLQLVEVLAEYFDQSEASLVFVDIQQSQIPTIFDRCNNEYAEAVLGGEDISKSSAPPER